MPTFHWPAYVDEWRGNKVSAFKIHRVKSNPAGPGRFLDLCTSDDIVQQIKLSAPGRAVDYEVPDALCDEYTHRLYFPEGPGVRLEPLLDLLSKVLSIRIPNTDVSIALDWYGIPPDAEHDYWRKTPLGLTRMKAKFYTSSPGVMNECRNKLATVMAQFIVRHPLYESADVIVATPGHDRAVLSCGEDLARRVADATGKRLIMTSTSYETREEVKGAHTSMEGLFSMPTSLSDLSAIVIDDVIMSGGTMKHMALAAREAGARDVFGLAPVRTMRGS